MKSNSSDTLLADTLLYLLLIGVPYMDKCEKCSKDGYYVVELNRVLCKQHADLLTAKHDLWFESTRTMERFVFDMNFKYKNKLSESDISDILNGVSQKVFEKDNLSS